MIKLYIGLVFILSSAIAFSSNAQKKCKYDFEKIDPFTNKTERAVYFRLNMRLVIIYSKIGDTYELRARTQDYGTKEDIIKAGSKLEIKLRDGSIIDFQSKKDVTPNLNSLDGTIVSSYNIPFPATRADFEKLSIGGFTAARVLIGDEVIAFELKAKKIPNTAAKAKCMLAE